MHYFETSSLIWSRAPAQTIILLGNQGYCESVFRYPLPASLRYSPYKGRRTR